MLAGLSSTTQHSSLFMTKFAPTKSRNITRSAQVVPTLFSSLLHLQQPTLSVVHHSVASQIPAVEKSFQVRWNDC